MEVSKNVQKVLDLVKEMKAIELNELVKALEEEFGVTAAAMVVAGSGAGAGGGDEGDAVSDSVKVELTDAGQQKIAVIKVVKEVLGLGLKEAKELVEKAPVIIKEGVKMDEAETLKNKLSEAGATISYK